MRPISKPILYGNDDNLKNRGFLLGSMDIKVDQFADHCLGLNRVDLSLDPDPFHPEFSVLECT